MTLTNHPFPFSPRGKGGRDLAKEAMGGTKQEQENICVEVDGGSGAEGVTTALLEGLIIRGM